MITRVVKMTFQAEKVAAFQEHFQSHKMQIRQFAGCHHLELWQDLQDERIFFTYSQWEGEEFLEAYRRSDLFRGVWARTKEWFAERPEAWSVQSKAVLN